MGKKGWALFVSLFLIFFIPALLMMLRPYFIASGNKQSILSPIPDFLSLLKNNEVSSLNLWLPSLDNTVNASVKKPDIDGQSALLYDLTTKKFLYLKNPKQKLPMASLTKIMTAVVAMEKPKKDNKYTVTSADLVGEDTMGLSAGETLSLKELLYGLVLHSGNDAAETLASAYPGGRSAFIKAMNDKVKTLGLTDTSFTNPTGLEGDGDQYTTAYDLLVITNYALTNFPDFRDVVSTFDYDIGATSTHKEYSLENETNLLSSYPGVKGVKTGYTPEAGLCLVTYLDYDGHKIIGVLLNSDNRIKDMKELLDYGLLSEGVAPPPHS